MRSPVHWGMRCAVLLPLLAVGLLTACQGEEADQPAETPTESAALPSAAPAPEGTAAADATTANAEEADECGAEKLGRWLNSLPTETVKTEIHEAVGHDRIRYIGPGDAVTLDFRPDRLNVETGTDGRIKLLRCG